MTLSNCQLTTDETSILELGLLLRPTYLNKEQTTQDFYSFIRCLEIFEYFHNNPDQKDSLNTNNNVDKERYP